MAGTGSWQVRAAPLRQRLPCSSGGFRCVDRGNGAALRSRLRPALESRANRNAARRLGLITTRREPALEALADPIAGTSYQFDQKSGSFLTVLPTEAVAAMFAPFVPSDPAVPTDPKQLKNAVRLLAKELEHALRRLIAAKLQAHYGGTDIIECRAR